MPGVTKLFHREVREELPTWERVQECILALRHEKTLSLEVDDDSFLIVLFINPVGYRVSGCGIGERDYYTLIDRSLGDDIVTAFDGGDTNDYPRYVFVGVSVLMKAVSTYYLTGQRDSNCEWVDDRDSLYD